MTRDELLELSDERLLKQCRSDCFRSTGPGGQHRNRNDTAVRLTLQEYPAITAEADESRSQHKNRSEAVKRLRLAIAYGLRSEDAEAWTGDMKLNARNPVYPTFIATIVDALALHGYQLSRAAEALGTTTGQLNKAMDRDARLWQFVNRERQKLGLKALRHKK